jgi:hypothetical protein
MVKKAGAKRRKEEKAKVQFKRPKTGPGIHLPKGTNVTKAEVKVGKIVIPKQLGSSAASKEAAGPVTRRKLSLEDLLSKLGHFSQSVRLESLEGLKELLTGEYGLDLVHQHLSLLIMRTIPLCADVEKKIRKNALTILQAVLSKVDSVILEPLYPLLTAHLSCCLTNIQPAIQRDALPLIDTLVTSAPAFIAANFGRILPDCVRQISADEHSASDKGGGGGRSSGVSNQVTDKIGSLEWRVNVLSRVNKILDCVCKKPQDLEEKDVDSAPEEFRENMHVSLVPTSELKHLTKLDLVQKNNKDPILDMIEKILPLILDSWIEATSIEGKDTRKSFLANDVYSLLSSVSAILDNLIQYADTFNNPGVIALIRTKYLADLNSKLFTQLPYSSNKGKCNKENLQLCSVILQLSPGINSNLLDKLVNILQQTSRSEGSIELVVFKQMLEHKNIDKTRKVWVGRQLIERSRAYKTGSREWRICLNILGRMSEYDSSLEDWVDTLPDILVTTKTKFESSIVMKIMLNLAQQRNQIFAKSYARNYDSIQDWLKSLEAKEDYSHRLMSFIHQNTIVHAMG